VVFFCASRLLNWFVRRRHPSNAIAVLRVKDRLPQESSHQIVSFPDAARSAVPKKEKGLERAERLRRRRFAVARGDDDMPPRSAASSRLQRNPPCRNPTHA